MELLEDGLLGQTVESNPKTKRELHGKVQNIRLLSSLYNSTTLALLLFSRYSSGNLCSRLALATRRFMSDVRGQEGPRRGRHPDDHHQENNSATRQNNTTTSRKRPSTPPSPAFSMLPP